ncbi:MAG TPA: 50S ribosomal protein L6 [bacterium]|nr:50S ribosomal protein L6 [bacterium]HPT29924.1 50S ribosomal protein L6 [bacterium]
MSRLGKLPIELVAGVNLTLSGSLVKVKGPKGELSFELPKKVSLEITEKEAIVKVEDAEDVKQRALWGLCRNLINNMVLGVTVGFEKKMEIKGVGYRTQVSGQKLTLNLGFSHPIEFPLPAGISAVSDGNFLTIQGIDKQAVGEVAAQIRRLRLPEPYKGKGIKYIDEVIRRKAGKTAASK